MDPNIIKEQEAIKIKPLEASGKEPSFPAEPKNSNPVEAPDQDSFVHARKIRKTFGKLRTDDDAYFAYPCKDVGYVPPVEPPRELIGPEVSSENKDVEMSDKTEALKALSAKSFVTAGANKTKPLEGLGEGSSVLAEAISRDLIGATNQGSSVPARKMTLKEECAAYDAYFAFICEDDGNLLPVKEEPPRGKIIELEVSGDSKNKRQEKKKRERNLKLIEQAKALLKGIDPPPLSSESSSDFEDDEISDKTEALKALGAKSFVTPEANKTEPLKAVAEGSSMRAEATNRNLGGASNQGASVPARKFTINENSATYVTYFADQREDDCYLPRATVEPAREIIIEHKVSNDSKDKKKGRKKRERNLKRIELAKALLNGIDPPPLCSESSSDSEDEEISDKREALKVLGAKSFVTVETNKTEPLEASDEGSSVLAEATNRDLVGASNQGSSVPARKMTLKEECTAYDAYFAFICEDDGNLSPVIEPKVSDDSKDKRQERKKSERKIKLIEQAKALLRGEDPPPLSPESSSNSQDDEMSDKTEALKALSAKSVFNADSNKTDLAGTSNQGSSVPSRKSTIDEKTNAYATYFADQCEEDGYVPRVTEEPPRERIIEHKVSDDSEDKKKERKKRERNLKLIEQGKAILKGEDPPPLSSESSSDSEEDKTSEKKKALKALEANQTDIAGPSNQGSSVPPRKLTTREQSAALSAYFAYICEDDDCYVPQVTVQPPIIEPEVSSSSDDSEDEEEERKQREYDRKLIAHCQALIRGEIPPPLSSEESSEAEDEVIDDDDDDDNIEAAVPDVERRFPLIEVFSLNNMVFVAIDPQNIDIDEGQFVSMRHIERILPDFSIQMNSPEEAILGRNILGASIDNFCNMRVVENSSIDTFHRDFLEFLSSTNEGGALYQMRLYCRVIPNRRAL